MTERKKKILDLAKQFGMNTKKTTSPHYFVTKNGNIEIIKHSDTLGTNDVGNSLSLNPPNAKDTKEVTISESRLNKALDSDAAGVFGTYKKYDPSIKDRKKRKQSKPKTKRCRCK